MDQSILDWGETTDPGRTRRRFPLWLVFAIPAALLLGLCGWVLTWDFEPQVKPHIFPSTYLEVTNKAYIGYTLEPFTIEIKGGEAVLLRLERRSRIYIKARGTTDIPLEISFGQPEDLKRAKLDKFTIEARVTATKWGLRRTMEIKEERTLQELVQGAIEALQDVMSQLP